MRGSRGWVLLLAITAITACGRVQREDQPASTLAEAGQSSGGGAAEGELPFLPWRVGNSWTYRVDNGLIVTEKTMTVGPLERAGGFGPSSDVLANLVTTQESDGAYTESWQGPDAAAPERILRFREHDVDPPRVGGETETWYAPGKLHFDGSPARAVAASSWLESYRQGTLFAGEQSAIELEQEESWVVVADDEEVTVPAGTFTAVLHLAKQGSVRSKDYWYVRGVGKVKEQGRQLEELISYQLEP